MKKINILMTALILFSDTVAYKSNAEYQYSTDGYTITYNISDDNTVSIMKCSGDGETFFMPDTIENLPVTEIESTAFITCTNLKKIEISENNLYFSFENDMLMNYEKTLLIKYTGTDTLAEIPYGIEKIKSKSFFGTKTEYIDIPQTVSYIEDYAFMGCTSLKRIDIPDSVTHLGKGCFFSCSSLENVRLSSTMTEICSDTFYACPKLQKLIIPQSIISIGNDILSSADDSNYKPVIYGFYDSIAKSYAYQNNMDFKMMGDADNDLLLNASDSSIILSEYASLSAGNDSSFDEHQSITADINFDGNIDAVDASLILSEYAKISSGG